MYKNEFLSYNTPVQINILHHMFVAYMRDIIKATHQEKKQHLYAESTESCTEHTPPSSLTH